MPKKNARRFVALFLSLFFISALIIALFNILVNPFQYFNTPTHAKYNQIKVGLNQQHRLHKALEIAKQKPEILFLGSSRVMAGMNPEDISSFTQGAAYNGAFAGGGIEEAYYYLKHALFYQPHLKMAIIGLDLFSFGKNKKAASDFFPKKLEKGLYGLQSAFPQLWSKKTLQSSWLTLKANFFENAQPYFLPNGLYHPSKVQSSENEYYVKGDAAYLKMIYESSEFYKGFVLGEDKIAWFKKLVELCRKKGIELKAFICPAKAIYWESLFEKGYWNDLEELKRKISALHPLWDFSGYNSITTQDSLYYECSHFKPVVGKLILAKFFEQEPGGDFGLYVTKETIENAITTIRQSRQNWLKGQSACYNNHMSQ